MKKKFSIIVLVLLSPQLVLDFSPDSAIQRAVKVAVPWFQLGAASVTIHKYWPEFFGQKNNTNNQPYQNKSLS